MNTPPGGNTGAGSLGGAAAKGAQGSFRPGDLVDRRYRIEAILGRGSFGVVYRASDVIDEAPVAIKEVIPEAAQVEDIRKRFSREIRILKNLEPHPNICAYLAELRQVPGMVMEFVGSPEPPFTAGRPLDGVVDEASDRLRATLSLGRQVADALAVMHAQGINHRDLKPANVLVHEGLVKLVDFGLARRTSMDQVTSSFRTATEMRLGTPAFMPPEQIRGDELDPRADLYSLGVILYRLSTGRMPFETHGGADQGAMTVLLMHLTEMPTSPRLQNPAIPPELDALIMRLLAKDRDARAATAEEVSRHLSTIEAALPEVVEGATGAAGAASVSAQDAEAGDGAGLEDLRYRLVGRDLERGMLGQACTRAATGMQVVALLGEPGIGKTRLARDLEERRLGKPFVAASLAAGLSETAADALSASVKATLAGGAGQGQAALDGPRCVLFLDDTDRADAASLERATGLVASLRGSPVLVLCAYGTRGPRGVREAQVFQERLRTAAGTLDVVPLGPLSRDAVAQLAREVLGAPLPEADLGLLRTKARGTPLPVVEWLRHLGTTATRCDEGFLPPSGWEHDVPGRLVARLEARVETAPEPLADCLSRARCLGRFDMDTMRVALGGDGERPDEEAWRGALQALVDEGWIEADDGTQETKAGNTPRTFTADGAGAVPGTSPCRYSIGDPLLSHSQYSVADPLLSHCRYSIADPLLWRHGGTPREKCPIHPDLHLRVASHLGHSGGDAETVARHLRLAGRHQAAIPFYEKAMSGVESTVLKLAFSREIVSLLQEQPDTPPETLVAKLLEEARLLASTGHPTEEAVTYERALDLATRCADPVWRAKVLLARARQLGRFGKPDEARASLEEGLALVEADGASAREWADLTMRLGQLDGDAGRGEEGLERLQQAMGVFERLQDWAGVAECHNWRGGLQKAAGRFAEARRAFLTAAVLARRHEVPRELAAALNNLGYLHTEAFRRYRRALRFLNRGLEIAGRHSLELLRLWLLLNRGVSYFFLGKWTECIEDWEALAESAERLHENRLRVTALVNMAEALGNRAGPEDREQGMDMARQGHDLARRLQWPLWQYLALFRLGWLELEQGEHEKAREHLRQAEQLSAQHGLTQERADLLNTLARCETALDEISSGEFREAERLEKAGEPGASPALTLLARGLHLLDTKPLEAEPILREALTRFREREEPLGQGRALTALGKILIGADDAERKKEGRRLLKEAVTLFDRLGAEEYLRQAEDLMLGPNV